MSPYEILYAGGSVEYMNEEPGQVWIERLKQTYEKMVWLNPLPAKRWQYTQSIIHPVTLITGKSGKLVKFAGFSVFNKARNKLYFAHLVITPSMLGVLYG